MKPRFWPLLLLAGCTSPQPAATPPAETAAEAPAGAVRIANPASEHCVQLGGRLEIRSEADGQRGYCHLPDGRVVEEWALFRETKAPPTE